MLLYALDADGKAKAIQAIPNGDGTWALNIGVNDVTVGAVEIPAVGDISDDEWPDTGDGTLIAVAKAIRLGQIDTNTKLDAIVSATAILANVETILESIRDTQEANRDLLTQIETQDEIIAANTAG